MIMPEPLTAACGQRGTYVEPITAACGSDKVKFSLNQVYFAVN